MEVFSYVPLDDAERRCALLGSRNVRSMARD
jgi:hypothetical protein